MSCALLHIGASWQDTVYKPGIFPTSLLSKTWPLTRKTTFTVLLALTIQVSNYIILSHHIWQAPGSYDNGPSLRTSTTSGTGTGGDYEGSNNLRSGIQSNTGRTGHGSSPLAQQYDQGTTTGQYDSSRSGEEGIESGAGFGRGQGDTGTGTGVGHHKAHQGGHLYGQDTGKSFFSLSLFFQIYSHTLVGVGAGDTRTTTDTSPLNLRQDETVAEQTRTGTYLLCSFQLGISRSFIIYLGGTTTGVQTGYSGDTTGYRSGNHLPFSLLTTPIYSSSFPRCSYNRLWYRDRQPISSWAPWPSQTSPRGQWW